MSHCATRAVVRAATRVDPVRVAPLAGGGAVVVRDGWVGRFGPDGFTGSRARALSTRARRARSGCARRRRGAHRGGPRDPRPSARPRAAAHASHHRRGAAPEGMGRPRDRARLGSLWSAAPDPRTVVRSALDGRSQADLRFDDVVAGPTAAKEGGRLLVRTGRPPTRAPLGAELREIALPGGRTVATRRGRPRDLADRAAAIAADDGTMLVVRGDHVVEVRSAATGRLVARCRTAPIPRGPVGADGTWWFAAGWPDVHLSHHAYGRGAAVSHAAGSRPASRRLSPRAVGSVSRCCRGPPPPPRSRARSGPPRGGSCPPAARRHRRSPARRPGPSRRRRRGTSRAWRR